MTDDTSRVPAAMAPLERLARAGFAIAGVHDVVDVRGLARRLDDTPAAGGPDGRPSTAPPRGVRVLAAISPRPLASADPTADAWVIAGDRVTAQRAGGQALTGEEAITVASLCRRVDEVLGSPHELHWVMSAGRLLIAASVPTGVCAGPLPPGTWIKDSDRYPEPFTALGASVAGPAISAGFTAMLERYGALLERTDLTFVAGEAYLRVTPVGGHDGAPPPALLVALLARTVPALRDRVRRAARAATDAALAERLRSYEEHDRPALQRRLSTLRGIDLADLADVELWQHLRSVLDLVRRALALHVDLIPAETVPVFRLVQWAAAVLGWDERSALELLAGCSPATSSPSRALAAVADRVRQRPALHDLLASGGDVAEALAAADPVAAELFAGWIDQFGARPVHDDPGSPLFAERPDLLAGLLLAAVDRDPREQAPTGAAARDRGRAQLARRPVELVAFERLLASAEHAYRVREDSALWTGSMPAGLVRRAALECGRRLVAAGLLDDPDDAVHLPAETLVDALPADHDGLDLPATAAVHRAAREQARAHPGPSRYGPPPPALPDVRLLPEPVRTLNAALLWSRPAAAEDGTAITTGHAAAPAVGLSAASAPATPPGAVELRGIAGSAGRYTGPVRRVLSEADFAAVRRGDVVVCRTTDPAWSVLFDLAGALVTDTGGLLSHAGIVAREFGLPAVLATTHATRMLVDGQIVTVDGTAGRVQGAPSRS